MHAGKHEVMSLTAKELVTTTRISLTMFFFLFFLQYLVYSKQNM